MVEIKFYKVGQLKEGQYVLIDGEVCKISTIQTSAPGKHGSAKARVSAVNVFTGAKKTLLKPSSSDVEVPMVSRGVAQVVAVMGDSVQLMDMSSYETFDVPTPEEYKGQLSAGLEVEYLKADQNFRIVRIR